MQENRPNLDIHNATRPRKYVGMGGALFEVKADVIEQVYNTDEEYYFRPTRERVTQVDLTSVPEISGYHACLMDVVRMIQFQ